MCGCPSLLESDNAQPRTSASVAEGWTWNEINSMENWFVVRNWSQWVHTVWLLYSPVTVRHSHRLHCNWSTNTRPQTCMLYSVGCSQCLPWCGRVILGSLRDILRAGIDNKCTGNKVNGYASLKRAIKIQSFIILFKINLKRLLV